jgi:hypothetical protein
LFFFFHDVIDFPTDVAGQAIDTRSLGRGQLIVRNLVLEDLFDFLFYFVEQDVVDHDDFSRMITAWDSSVKERRRGRRSGSTFDGSEKMI